jgi:alkanesulfonate monooxygenase SsuD/methylene tetrahydromethanopterin reductase-like flavin-dependent oxidoreductase (luciferase family)/predicted kinase
MRRVAGTERFDSPSILVLVGPSGSGKSAWAAAHFAETEIVSSDRLRSVAGSGESDLDASADAFRLLRDIVSMRARRGLTSIVDTLGYDRELRLWLVELANEFGVPVHAVVFATPAKVCRERNAARPKRVPAAVLSSQLKAFGDVRQQLEHDGFSSIRVLEEPVRTRRHQHSPAGTPEDGPAPDSTEGVSRVLRFGLQISSFPGPSAALRSNLAEWAGAAEAAGFDSIWVMDHFRQIPQIGREWDDMPESIATLSFLAGHTSRATLGSLVHCVTHRNLGVLGKSLATLDVLSGGRAVCGIGLGWFAAEHRAYGIDFPSVNDRYALLEDALQFLPMLWGKGAPAFQGRMFNAPQALGYPRPIQARIPMLVGGDGERRTLRLVAQFADACNLFGDPTLVRRKVGVLRQHCQSVGRAPSDISVTHLSSALVGTNAQDVAERVAGLRLSPRTVATLAIGTIDDHVDRVVELASAGVDHVIVSLADLSSDSIERFGRVIERTRGLAVCTVS